MEEAATISKSFQKLRVVLGGLLEGQILKPIAQISVSEVVKHWEE